MKSLSLLTRLAACLPLLGVSTGLAQTVLITGANSGIGLEFAKQYAAKGWTVIATHRRDSDPDTLVELMQQYPNVRAERMDVTSIEEVRALAAKLEGTPIDILLNNAGIFLLGEDWHENAQSDGQAFGTFDWDQFDQFMATNVRGPIMVAEAFVDHVAASEQKKILNISSENGRVSGDVYCCGLYWYRMSKAALNKLMRQLAVELKPRGITVILFDPGAVRVEKQADFDFPGMIETDFTVTQMIATAETLDIDDTGRFVRYDGADTPW